MEDMDFDEQTYQEAEEREQHVEHKNDCQCPANANNLDTHIRQKSLT